MTTERDGFVDILLRAQRELLTSQVELAAALLTAGAEVAGVATRATERAARVVAETMRRATDAAEAP